MKYTDKTEVTRAEYLQIVGLLTLAKRHNDHLEEIRDAVMQLTGETDESGHSGDAVYTNIDADELLGKLGITVSANTEVNARAEGTSQGGTK